MKHTHSVYDSDAHFTIDPKTRIIKPAPDSKSIVIQYDHNSERFTFDLERFIDGHDMFLCNKVEVHYINVDSKKSRQKEGVYTITDFQLSPDSSNVVCCSWLISANATN